ncbi:hypothetical protein MRY87_01575 [bacterium]|nr:hypothetical protein [bacterium]
MRSGDIPTMRGASTAVCDHEGEERFLFLYLSLMLAVFSIVTLLQIAHPAALSPAREEQQDGEGRNPAAPPLETRHGDEQVPVGETHFSLFHDEDASLDESAAAALIFLLQSHDLRATISLVGDRARPSLAYARALALQHHLQRHAFSARDVRVEVHFSPEPQDESLLALVRF